MIVFIIILIIVIILNRNRYFDYKKVSNRYNLFNVNYLMFKNGIVEKGNIVVLKEDLEILKLLEEKYIEKRK